MEETILAAAEGSSVSTHILSCHVCFQPESLKRNRLQYCSQVPRVRFGVNMKYFLQKLVATKCDQVRRLLKHRLVLLSNNDVMK